MNKEISLDSPPRNRRKQRPHRIRSLACATGYRRLVPLVLLLLFHTSTAFAQKLEWTKLPNLPDTIGFGGPLVGVHNDALIVAGGANFPHGPPWGENPGKKVWHDEIYVLPKGEEKWRTGFKLPTNLAYGATVSTKDGVIIIGGQDSKRSYADVRMLSWVDEKIKITELPSLPEPSSYLAATLVGDTIYVLPGARTRDPGDLTDLTDAFWKLDLSKPKDERKWKELAKCTGGPRVKAVLAAQKRGPHQFVYLFSGEKPKKVGGRIQSEYLTDGWRYDPKKDNWTRCAGPEECFAAAPCIASGQGHILVFSGDTGEHVRKPVERRPTFTKRILGYHTATDRWAEVGEMPVAVVTTLAVRRGEEIILASGEIKPGVRTNTIQVLKIKADDTDFGVVNWLVLGGYLAALIAIGVFASRKTHDTGDYFLAGRKIPWWAAGLSIYSTQLSAITFVALPALAFTTDWLILPGFICIFLIAPVVIFFYLPFFRRLNVTTAYEYLERRFNVAARIFGSLSFIVFQLGRMAVVIYLPALALASVTGLSSFVCIVLMGVLATAYTVLGGMRAVIWTDVMQTFVLLGGLLLALALVFTSSGESGFFADASSEGKLRMFELSQSLAERSTWIVLLGFFFLQFGPYTTDQAVIQRYLTTPDEKAAARGIWLNGIISPLMVVLFFALGTGLWAFYRGHPEMLSVGMKNDAVLPLFIAQQFPVGLAGLVIAGIFAASMSSLDSSLHSITTCVSTDFVKRFKKNVTEQQLFRFARGLTILLGIVATITALWLAGSSVESLFTFFLSLVALLSSGLVAMFLLGIFTKKANGAGALCGALLGTAGLFAVRSTGLVHADLYAFIGIGVSFGAGYAASFFLPGKPAPQGMTYADIRKRE